MIRSKFAIGQVYVISLFLMGFTAFGIYLLAHRNELMRNKFGTTSPAWIPGMIIVGGGGVMFYLLLKKMVLLKIYPDRLELRSLFFNRIIYRPDIASIDVSGRENIGFLSNSRLTSAIVIECSSAEKFVLADIFYRNMPRLKQALAHFLSQGHEVSFVAEDTRSREPLPYGEEDMAEMFAGNPLVSVNTITYFACLLILFLIPHRGGILHLSPFYFLMALFYVPLYFAFGAQMFYFKLSDKYLLIKNHYFPWYRRGYRLDEIKKIVFENPYKRSHTLQVTTKNFVSKAFAAGSLRDDNWKALKEKLESRGIAVRNEIYIPNYKSK